MSHDPSSPKKLIYMANQIGKFFAPQEHGKAVAGIANHLTRFWDPSMRKKIDACEKREHQHRICRIDSIRPRFQSNPSKDVSICRSGVFAFVFRHRNASD